MNTIKKLRILLFFVFIALILFVSVNAIKGNGPTQEILQIRDIDGNPFQTSLTRGRLALIQAIVNDRSFIIDKYAKSAYPDVLYANGHYYSVFVPGASFLGTPLYLLGMNLNLGVLFLFFLGPIFILLTAIIIYKMLRTLSFNSLISALTTLIIVFGTSIYPYSVIFNAHPIAAFSIALSMYGAVKVIVNKHFAIGNILFWFAFGIGMLSDYPNAISILPIGIVLFLYSFKVIQRDNKKLLSVNLSYFFAIFASLIGIIPLLFYTHSLFGTIFTTIETHQIQGYVNDQGERIYELADNPQFYLQRQVLNNPLRLDPIFTPNGLFTLLLSPQRGLFFFSPILLFALLGINDSLRKNKLVTYAGLFAIALTVIAYSSYTDYAGGWSFGTRFLIGITPIIAIFLAHAINKYLFKNILFFVLFIFMGLTSFFISTLGAFTSRVNPSTLAKEFADCVLQCSWMREIPILSNGKYMSYVYNEYLQQNISRISFFSLILGMLTLVFLSLVFMLHRSLLKK